MAIQWITRERWQAMLVESDVLLRQATNLRRAGRRNDHIWRELAPLNKLIRSPNLKVRGIDDRTGGHHP